MVRNSPATNAIIMRAQTMRRFVEELLDAYRACTRFALFCTIGVRVALPRGGWRHCGLDKAREIRTRRDCVTLKNYIARETLRAKVCALLFRFSFRYFVNLDEAFCWRSVCACIQVPEKGERL